VYHAPYTEGVIIIDVVLEGPAQKAGLQKGDIITHINETEITSEDQFLRQLWEIPLHSQFQITCLRQNTQKIFKLWGIDRYEFYNIGGSPDYFGQ
jgi:putative serine protease PepD